MYVNNENLRIKKHTVLSFFFPFRYTYRQGSYSFIHMYILCMDKYICYMYIYLSISMYIYIYTYIYTYIYIYIERERDR